LVALRDLLPGAKRRRKAPRADAPKTIVPPRAEPAAKRFDEARDRLRREIPPPDDDA